MYYNSNSKLAFDPLARVRIAMGTMDGLITGSNGSLGNYAKKHFYGQVLNFSFRFYEGADYALQGLLFVST